MQQVLCIAIETIAGMATKDFGRRLKRTDRLVGMND